VFNSRKECEFCKRDHKENCEFTFSNPKVCLKDIVRHMDASRNLVFVVNWRSSNPRANIGLLERNHTIEVDMSTQTDSFSKRSSKVDLYDCLNYFSMDETLSGDDKWYCSKCQDHVVARKKMELFRAPPYLIVHFKRFSHRGGMFGSRKINDSINFPVNGLDMTRYVIQRDGSSLIYDLYAVSNHFGSMGGGHYTAYAKNPIYDKWFEFDDSYVSKATESSCVTGAAYVLFYKKR
jgi:ubiquitin C-terminal hydrolase